MKEFKNLKIAVAGTGCWAFAGGAAGTAPSGNGCGHCARKGGTY